MLVFGQDGLERLAWGGSGSTHRDEDAMQVSRRACLVVSAHDRRQPLHVTHAHDVNVVLAAERLDQREMDLQRYVALIFFISSQHAKGHIVRVPAEQMERTRSESMPPPGLPATPTPTLAHGAFLYSHIQDFGGLVDASGQTALALRRQQKFVQCFPGALHPVKEPAP